MNLQEALGPLAALYADPQVLEIMVDAPDRVLVERESKLAATELRFASAEVLRRAIDDTLAVGGVTFGPGETIAEAQFPDGGRAIAVLPPVAADGPYLVVRKPLRNLPTAEQLLEWNVVSREGYALLQSAVRARQNLLVAGGTGSGKTTLLTRLAEEIPPDERVVAVETLADLQIRHPRAVRLSSAGSPGLTYSDLIRAAARMRPDRLVCGEVRGAEAASILDLIGVGHEGSMLALHAATAEDALARLEAMCLMANLGLGLSEIRNRIAATLQLVTVQQRLPDGRRKLALIAELRGLEFDRYILQPLVRYNVENDSFEMTGATPRWMSR